MGMFDWIVYKDKGQFQTKSLECDLDNYEVREDGTLWHEEYDTEDQSDPDAPGLLRFAGMLTRTNKRWVQVKDFTGEIKFHVWNKETNSITNYSLYYYNGELREEHLLSE